MSHEIEYIGFCIVILIVIEIGYVSFVICVVHVCIVCGRYDPTDTCSWYGPTDTLDELV